MMNTNIELPDVNNPSPPSVVGTPMSEIKPAANYVNVSYGGIQQIDASSMRQNYIARLTNVLTDKSNEKGISSGGGNYVNCLYDTINTTAKDPYACGGYKKYKDSYGDSAKGCVVSFDEY